MECLKSWICLAFVIFKCVPCDSIVFLIAPEDVSTGLAAVYGFSPKLLKGNDHRFGFGFRFGNHADLQVLYELGPQLYTKPLQPVRVRSASYRTRFVRRRPLLELLVRAGLLDVRTSAYEFDVEHRDFDEPR